MTFICQVEGKERFQFKELLFYLLGQLVQGFIIVQILITFEEGLLQPGLGIRSGLEEVY